MRYLLFICALIGNSYSAIAAPILQTKTPCDTPVDAATDPTVPYSDDSEAIGAPPATLNDWNKDNAASFDFPIYVSPSELRPGLKASDKLDETAIGVGGVRVDNGNADVSVLGHIITGTGQPQPQTGSSGCTHLNGK